MSMKNSMSSKTILPKQTNKQTNKKNEEIKPFSDKQKLRAFVASGASPQEILTIVFQAELKGHQKVM